jgi:hypothetical protein
VDYFYYPTQTNDTSQYAFSIIKENAQISASNWNAYSSSVLNTTMQVPRLTVSVWSGKFIYSSAFFVFSTHHK